MNLLRLQCAIMCVLFFLPQLSFGQFGNRAGYGNYAKNRRPARQVNQQPSQGSTVIQVGGVVGTSSVRVPEIKESPRTSLNARQRRWEQILAQSYSASFTGTMSCGHVLRKLRSLGLPVSLNESAKHDSLTEDDQLTFVNPNLPLYEVLEESLSHLNATIVITGNRVSIISRDVATSPEFFLTITYDVSGFEYRPEEFDFLIKGAIAPEDWDDTNGDGTFHVSQTGNRTYLTISQNYGIQRQVREFLEGLVSLQGTNSVVSSIVSPAYVESQVIEIPFDKAESREGGFGGGIGGYGLGGGIF